MSFLFGDSLGDSNYFDKIHEENSLESRKKNEAKRKAIAEENERIDKLAANIIAITAESFLIKSTRSLVTLSAPSLILRTL